MPIPLNGEAGPRKKHVRGGLIVALVSAKGSPGVTTTAVGLAARWPAPEAVVLEADPAGGDLAARFGAYHEPGLAAMALDARDPAAPVEPRRWAQRLPCGPPAILAAPGVAAAAGLAALGDRASSLLESAAREFPAVVVDAGRWQPGSDADVLLAGADLVLVVARPSLDELRQVEARTAALRTVNPDVWLVLVGGGDWPPEEVAASLGVAVAGVLPFDRQGSAVLSGRSVPRRGWESGGWTRLPLLRGCRALAERLSNSRPRPEPPPEPPGPQVINGQLPVREIAVSAVAR